MAADTKLGPVDLDRAPTKLEQINEPDVPKSDLEEAREALKRCDENHVECCGLSGHLEWALDELESTKQQAAQVFREYCEVKQKIEDALDASRKEIGKQRDALAKACRVLSSKLLDEGKTSWNDADVSYAMGLVKEGPLEIDRLCDRIHEHEMTIQELRSLLEWRPIETAPKDGTKILARIGGDTALIFWVGDEMGHGAYPWCRDCECSGVYHPEGAFTHWLPLPPPPEGKR